MKRTILLLLMLNITVNAADEIRAFSGATTCWACVRQPDGDVWYVSGQAFEAWGTAARTATDYDIAMTDESGMMFVGDMDTNIAAGYYYLVTHEQAGGAPADADPAIWQEYGYWTGSTWYPGRVPWTDTVADFAAEAEFGGELGGLDPNLTAVLADTDELQTDWTDGGRLDTILDAIKAMTDLIAIVDTTVASPNDANNFTITAGLDVNDAYDWNLIMVEDAGDSHSEVRWIEDWQTGREIYVDEPFGFVPAAGDKVWIMGTSYGGYLYEVMSALKLSSIPTYYISGPNSSQGTTTYYYNHSGVAPP